MPKRQFLLPFIEPTLRFIVHLHQATHLHYDLRLEYCGVLLDFVLPKGPSTNPKIARLAKPQDDHQLSCLKVEGIIQPGRYGAGPILAWDIGVYAPVCPSGMPHEEAIRQGLANGLLRLMFYGSKLKGIWEMRRFHDNWLFVKENDEFASETDILLRNRSVFSGRTLYELKSRPYALWTELKDFYTEPIDMPHVVYRDGAVLDANKAARLRGVQAGIPLRQAKAILQGGVFKPWHHEDYEDRHRAWLDLCIDYTGVIEPADQHSAWLDLSLHPNPVDVAESLVRTLSRKVGLKVRYGTAPSKWISYLAAKHNDCGLALRDPKSFLATLPTSELLPVPPEHRDRLRFLGYHTIGEIADLSLRTLQDQFDEAGLVIHSAANGLLTQRVEAVYPSDSIADSIVFDGDAETTDAVDRACMALAERIGERLQERSMQSGKLRATLEREGGKLKPLSRTFTKPLRCRRSVYCALKLLIEPALDQSISSIRVQISDLEKIRLFQSSLIDSASAKDNPRVVAAMKHVRTVFGDKSVQLGSELVLPRRLKVLKEWKHATGWR